MSQVWNEILRFSTDVQVEMGENVIDLVSQHPILYDKHYDSLNIESRTIHRLTVTQLVG